MTKKNVAGLFFLSLPSAPQTNVAKMKAHGEGGRNGSWEPRDSVCIKTYYADWIGNLCIWRSFAVFALVIIMMRLWYFFGSGTGLPQCSPFHFWESHDVSKVFEGLHEPLFAHFVSLFELQENCTHKLFTQDLSAKSISYEATRFYLPCLQK